LGTAIGWLKLRAGVAMAGLKVVKVGWDCNGALNGNTCCCGWLTSYWGFVNSILFDAEAFVLNAG
jgi:hypothetical protein